MTNDQNHVHLAAMPDGGFIAVWASNHPGAAAESQIFAQRYTSDGTPQDGEVQISATAGITRSKTEATALDGGGFVVTWDARDSNDVSVGIFARQFDAAGDPVAGEFRVNTSVTGDLAEHSTTQLVGGGFVVVWQSDLAGNVENYGQRFDSAGAPIGGEFLVNPVVLAQNQYPDVTPLDDGGFIVTSTGSLPGQTQVSLIAQRFDDAGAASGGPLVLSQSGSTVPILPSTAILADGNAVTTFGMLNFNTNAIEVFGQRFDPAGTLIGGAFEVNSHLPGFQFLSETIALADGGFLVAWASEGQDGSGYGIYGQRFDAVGGKVGVEFQINTATNLDQALVNIAELADGSIVAAWTSDQQDSSGLGIYAQRLSVDAVNGGGGDGGTDGGGGFALADGDGPLRIEGFVLGSDMLDLSGLTDENGNPVTTDSVDVNDDDDGNAVLTFQNGETITLVGVRRHDVNSKSELEDIGVPPVSPEEVGISESGGSEGDAITGTDFEDQLRGRDGEDTLSGGGGDDTLDGGSGDDTLDGGGANDFLRGRGGSDLLSGGEGMDTLSGGKGDDTLDGGAGDDELDGGGGLDTFVVSGGNDTITDFSLGEDQLDIGGIDINDLALELGTDGAILLTWGTDNSLTLHIDDNGYEVTIEAQVLGAAGLPDAPEMVTDLTLLDFSTNDATLSDGEDLELDFRAANIGNEAGRGVTSFFWSADNALDGADVLIGTESQGKLSGGETNYESTEIDGETLADLGSGFVFAVIDADGLVEESDEANNTRGPIEIIVETTATGPLLADLEFDSGGANLSELTEDDDLIITYVVANSGNAEARSETQFYYSEDAIFDGADVLVHTDGNGRMDIGEHNEERIRLRYDDLAELGDGGYIFVVVDGAMLVDEHDETNNTSAGFEFSFL